MKKRRTVTCLGRCKPLRSSLGRLEWKAPTRTATIFVGQNKGKKRRSNEGHCATAPSAYDAGAIDRQFSRIRGQQVGHENVGATRMQNRGWYKGDEEASVAYQVIHDPYAPGESEWGTFVKRMKTIAERLSKSVCQDEVLVTFDDGKGKTTYSYSSRKRGDADD